MGAGVEMATLVAVVERASSRPSTVGTDVAPLRSPERVAVPR
jgi:hypothetical protein